MYISFLLKWKETKDRRQEYKTGERNWLVCYVFWKYSCATRIRNSINDHLKNKIIMKLRCKWYFAGILSNISLSNYYLQTILLSQIYFPLTFSSAQTDSFYFYNHLIMQLIKYSFEKDWMTLYLSETKRILVSYIFR